MTALARLLAGSPRAIMLPERSAADAPGFRMAGIPRMDVSADQDFGRLDMTGIVVADWQRSARSRKK